MQSFSLNELSVDELESIDYIYGHLKQFCAECHDIQSLIQSVLGDCDDKTLDSLFAKFQSAAFSAVSDLLSLDSASWASLESRPVPLISISRSGPRLFMYGRVPRQLQFDFTPITLTTTAKCLFSATRIIEFRQQCDEFILLQSFPVDANNVSLAQILATKKNGMHFVEYRVANLPTIRLLLTRSDRKNRNDDLKLSYKVGTKFKCQILESSFVLDSCTESQLAWYHALCRHFCALIHSTHTLQGFEFYAYKTQPKFISSDDRKLRHEFVAIQYDPHHSIDSIQEYHQQFDEKEIERQQRLYSPHDTTPILNLLQAHTFYTGLIRYPYLDFIDDAFKDKLVRCVFDWALHRDYGFAFYNDNIVKLFNGYRYVWKGDGYTSQELIEQKTKERAYGLRVVMNDKEPDWPTELVQKAKNAGFVANDDQINQISANIYYHNGQTLNVQYSGLDPHVEWDKFSKVYSITLHSDDFDSYLCFNLKSNRCNGDLRIPLQDRTGLIMNSLVSD